MALTKTPGRVVVRTPSEIYRRLKQHLTTDTHVEQMALAGVKVIEVDGDVCLHLLALFLPEGKDHATHSAALVEPSKNFKRDVYEACHNAGFTPCDIHTHCHTGKPRFSGTDDRFGEEDARFVQEHFEGRYGLPMIVFGNDMGGYEGRIWDNELECWHRIDEIQVLGVDGRIIRAEDQGFPEDNDPSRDRQLRIPGYRHHYTTRQLLVVAGVGGNGSRMVEEVSCLGLGKDASVAVIDHDIIEQSNLARIPYASKDDIGKPKVEVAARYLRERMPGTTIHAMNCRIDDPACQGYLTRATLLLGCGDNDGLRSVLNRVAVQNLSVYIDAGCDIQGVEEDGESKLVAGGQVRVVIPGVNACMVCCGAYDPTAAAYDLMTPEQAEGHRAVGYVRGMDDQRAPSISVLNAMCASAMTQAFVSLGHSNQFKLWHYLRFDLLTGETITAVSEKRPSCPLCGYDGQLGEGSVPKPLPNSPQNPDLMAAKQVSESDNTESPEVVLLDDDQAADDDNGTESGVIDDAVLNIGDPVSAD